jgi:hypothetical protein
MDNGGLSVNQGVQKLKSLQQKDVANRKFSFHKILIAGMRVMNFLLPICVYSIRFVETRQIIRNSVNCEDVLSRSAKTRPAKIRNNTQISAHTFWGIFHITNSRICSATV